VRPVGIQSAPGSGDTHFDTEVRAMGLEQGKLVQVAGIDCSGFLAVSA
jgi:hypothetical protein